MEGIAARTSQGNVLTSQRSPIGDKDFPRVSKVSGTRFFEAPKCRAVSKFKTGTQGQAVKLLKIALRD